MDPETKLKELTAILNEVADLKYAGDLLDWDQQTYMPPGGAANRAYQQATLAKLRHIKFTAPEVGQILDDLQPWAAELDPDSDEARLIKVTRRKYEKKAKVPSEFMAEFTKTKSNAHLVWQQARQQDDFAKFLPYLEKIVALRREYADFFTPYDHVYDPLLDDFEPGLKTTEVQEIFNALRPQQVELLKAISDQPQVDDSFLHQPFDEFRQEEFGMEVISKYGYDWNRGRQDRTAHPFTTSFGLGDVRITTRFIPDYLGSALFSTLHEAGHAIYEQGIASHLDRTPLAEGTSLAVHESQSRMYENVIGRSYDFWTHFYGRLQELFPSQLKGVDLDTFYKGINKVEPSLIRVEADEATYNLHIMLRLELEIALMEGTLEVADLPEAWNSRMEEYLGLTPPNDADGVLQDVHWSSGYVGYFSTYALGNLISAQLWEKVNEDIPDLADQIRRGEFTELTGWMREKIHRHGSKFEPQEMVERVTGSKIDPAAYMRYLRTKYTEIYGL
jgi:carboxypeptidase Taq